jgi:hypothetical protein
MFITIQLSPLQSTGSSNLVEIMNGSRMVPGAVTRCSCIHSSLILGAAQPTRQTITLPTMLRNDVLQHGIVLK